MNRQAWNALAALMWLVLPAIALPYWFAWTHLPPRLATHFGANGLPNGWMPREMALAFPLIITTVLLLIFTVILARVSRPDASSWAIMGLFYLILGVVYWGASSVLSYNVSGQPVEIGSVALVVFLAILATVVIFLASKRGANLPASPVLADEVHAGRLWSLLFVVPMVAELMVMATVPNAMLRLALGLLTLVLLGFAALAWSGFHYIFSGAGLEIRTLGFRLRSVPLDHIREYGVDNWSLAGGYGIRGIGDRRAYVWGNRGVRIKTTEGEVFLGHDDPERIVRDLDAIRQSSRVT